MVSCWECGSAGHPTCLDWEDMRIVRRVLGYCWMCSDCKRCELCDEKGEDVRDVLFPSCGQEADWAERRTTCSSATRATGAGTALASPLP